MNTTHTPGNWYADGEMVFSEHGSRVADCTQNEEDFRVPSDSEIEANARLIAAAPALVDACNEALKFLMDGTPDNAISPAEKTVRDLISAALKKAVPA